MTTISKPLIIHDQGPETLYNLLLEKKWRILLPATSKVYTDFKPTIKGPFFQK